MFTEMGIRPLRCDFDAPFGAVSGTRCSFLATWPGVDAAKTTVATGAMRFLVPAMGSAGAIVSLAESPY